MMGNCIGALSIPTLLQRHATFYFGKGLLVVELHCVIWHFNSLCVYVDIYASLLATNAV